jgi:hypothetical protein
MSSILQIARTYGYILDWYDITAYYYPRHIQVSWEKLNYVDEEVVCKGENYSNWR